MSMTAPASLLAGTPSCFMPLCFIITYVVVVAVGFTAEVDYWHVHCMHSTSHHTTDRVSLTRPDKIS